MKKYKESRYDPQDKTWNAEKAARWLQQQLDSSWLYGTVAKVPKKFVC